MDAEVELGCCQPACFTKLYHVRSILGQKCEELSRMEAQIRWELQGNDGHRPTINNNFPTWVEDVARIRDQVEDLISLGRNDLFGSVCWPWHHSKVGHQLLRRLNFLIESASSLLSYGSVVRESQIFMGKEMMKSEEIWECLMDPTIGSIGIYGPGGVGKTTIIMNIVDQLTNTDTFDKIVLVTISKGANWERVGENIAMQLGIDLFEYERKDRLLGNSYKSRYEILCEHLQNMEKCLFIFDDLWDPAPEWVKTMIPAPTRENGFKIVTISRFCYVCEQMGVNKVISLAPLSDRDAWDLFVRETGDHVLDHEIQAIAEEIVQKCHGLPINVITISRAMRGKTDATSWSQALNYLQKEMRRTGTDNILKFCYRSLRNDNIRKCFLYCGFFPVGYRFKSQELIRYWMAEDFIHNEGDIVAGIEEGVGILRELQDANMLGMFTQGGNDFLKMHDLIRDFSINIMYEKKDIVAKAGLQLERFYIDEEHIWPKKISYIGNQIQRLDSDFDFQYYLSTLLLKGNLLTDVSLDFFFNIRNLQVLDMSHSEISILPSSINVLRKLCALFLQNCTYLCHMPSLGNLQELQYLNLSGTLIKELPRGIERLVKLRSLDLSDTALLEYMHPGALSSLTNLEELLMQGSRICKINSPAAAACLKEIRCFKHLSILTLSAIGFQDHLDTILYLQGHNLKIFTVNVFGSAEDCV